LQSSARSNALSGTLTLDASRSNLLGSLAQSQLLTIRVAGDSVLTVEDTWYADGTRTTVQCPMKPDGREYPASGTARLLVEAQTVVLTRVNASTMKWTYKKGAEVLLTVVGEVSPEGNTLTMTTGDDRRLVYLRLQ